MLTGIPSQESCLQIYSALGQIYWTGFLFGILVCLFASTLSGYYRPRDDDDKRL